MDENETCQTAQGSGGGWKGIDMPRFRDLRWMTLMSLLRDAIRGSMEAMP
jgi:hypothetical protein